ncbi:RNA 2',3'-cyclic phosphodiesterase [Thiovibrio sp. JS02]
MYRLFTAIDLPEDVVARLCSICYGLPGAKWVQAAQMHLTLRFIGEVDGGVFQDIREGLAEIQAPAFSLRVRGLGCFPAQKAPRVLWAGLTPTEEVSALRNRIENALVRMGLAPEGRKYSPHITLARLRDAPLARVSRFLAGNGLFGTESFPVSEFHLYSSELTPRGAFHAIEASYPLRS